MHFAFQGNKTTVAAFFFFCKLNSSILLPSVPASLQPGERRSLSPPSCANAAPLSPRSGGLSLSALPDLHTHNVCLTFPQSVDSRREKSQKLQNFSDITCRLGRRGERGGWWWWVGGRGGESRMGESAGGEVGRLYVLVGGEEAAVQLQ